ncbi:hypothetical protein [Comamonas thiooxydans]|nr:hypothetical protein [Comamonas thiooxydans]
MQTIRIMLTSVLDASGSLSNTGGVRCWHWREAGTNFVEAIDIR